MSKKTSVRTSSAPPPSGLRWIEGCRITLKELPTRKRKRKSEPLADEFKNFCITVAVNIGDYNHQSLTMPKVEHPPLSTSGSSESGHAIVILSLSTSRESKGEETDTEEDRGRPERNLRKQMAMSHGRSASSAISYIILQSRLKLSQPSYIHRHHVVPPNKTRLSVPATTGYLRLSTKPRCRPRNSRDTRPPHPIKFAQSFVDPFSRICGAQTWRGDEKDAIVCSESGCGSGGRGKG